MKKLYTVFFALFIAFQLSAQVFTDSNLPIVIINTDIDPNTGQPTEIVDEPKIVASMKIIYHTDGSRNFVSDQNNADFLDYDGRIGIEIRGSTSQSLPKKPYSLETRLNDDVSNNNVKILGMPKENDWVLNSLAFDKSLIRDYISYNFARDIGEYASRGQYCEVVINGDYKGLYIFMEKIKVDSDRINVADLTVDDNQFPEVTGGYYTKCDKVNTGETVAWSYPTSSGPSARFLHAQPDQEDVTSQQNSYIKSVFDNLLSTANAQNSSITNGYPSVIDIPSFVDFMLLNELGSNVDAYQYSTYFHKDRGGKLRAGPIWDFNLTYGNDAFGNRSGTGVWQFDNGDNVGPAFWKNLFNNPTFKCYLSKRWQDLTAAGQTLAYATLETEIDNLGVLLAEAKTREHERWNTLNGYNQEIINLKSWLQDRYTFLNANLNVSASCTFPSTPSLVISKINYHPVAAGGYDDDDLEFIGITNNSSETINLTGVYFRALGISYQFPQNATIGAGGIMYLANNAQVFEAFYGITAFGEYYRDLSNKTQQLQLSDAYGNTIDDVTYSDSDPWSEDADGDGAYLVLNDLNSDNSQAINWSTTTNYRICSGSTTWQGPTLGWNNGMPDNSIEAVISSDYETSLYGDIEACALIVKNGATLTVGANEYIKIKNDITVNGVLFVTHEGSLVQVDDAATVTNNGSITVRKITPLLNERDFMILGSPMTAETRSGVYGTSIIVRNHNTINFVPNPDVAIEDPDAENFADDNGNDWLNEAGSINAGEGYLVFPQPDITSGGAYTLDYTLGTLNNGEIAYDVTYNGTQNASPNIMGNPYASAINADIFMDQNSSMVDAVYFWEHLTEASSSYPGYKGNNYDMGDISIYNGSGGVAAANDPTGLDTKPNNYIASGQGFGFKATAAGTAIFNNSMRVTDNNNTYTRPANTKNRLWLQISNQNYGLNSTVLISFSEESTDGLDSKYDAKRLATPVSLYSKLDTGEELAIQGRSVFNVDEVVSLGFVSQIEANEEFKISINEQDGLVWEDTEVYLIDKTNGEVHNLSVSDYVFNSIEGAYNDRFLLMFKSTVLGVPNHELQAITIVPNPTATTVSIISPDAEINSVEVYDVHGRKLMQVVYDNNQYILDLSSLQSATYFVKIDTHEGWVTKRVIKQ